MPRPAVDVVVPFRGSAAELHRLRARLGRLRLRPGDSVLVVDNRPGGEPSPPADGDGDAVPVLAAAERHTPGYARNRGAARGHADWILFFDADVVPPDDLLDRYFDPPPGERTALVAGGVRDEPVPPDAPAAARYAYIRGLTSQDDSFRFGTWGFPKTANALFRRAAFDAVGGFREDVRAAEDADLSYRLRDAGWELERRESAAAVHLARQTVRGLVAQKLMHGAGAAWLAGRYPGAFPARRRPGLAWWGARTAARGLVEAARGRDRDRALWAVLEPLEQVTFELGRSLPNTRPPGGGSRRPARPGAPGGDRALSVCAVVAPGAGEEARRQVLAGLERQRRAPDEVAPAGSGLGAVACEWLWLLDGTAVPEPDALGALLDALAELDALPEPVLLASRVVAPGGSPDPGSLPVPAVAADLAVAAVRLRLLAIRAARPGSLLVHRGAIERWGPPPGGGDDLVWTARLLRGRWGVLVPGSVAVRAAASPPARVSARGWARLLLGDALTQREKPWFAFRLAEDAWARARGGAGRRARPARSRRRSRRSGA